MFMSMSFGFINLLSGVGLFSPSGCVGGANPNLPVGVDGKVTARPLQSFQASS